ncbi:MAG: hypothetical protein R3B13_38620 [Polyangiaceae bacterium]
MAASRVLPHHWRYVVLGLGLLGCSFPDHTFVDDDQFYDSGTTGGVGATGAGGFGGVGASSGGASASGGASGGVGATGGSGGVTGGSGGATGGSGGATGGSGGATGGSGGSGNENCTNGVDDDGDTKIDCEDTDCQSGYTCAPVVPAGWTGPVAVYSGSNAAPDCLQSGGYQTVKLNANNGLLPGTVTCPTCTCDGSTGVSCEASLVFMTDGTCSGGPCWGGDADQVKCGSAPYTDIVVQNGIACDLIPTLISSDGSGAKAVWMGPLRSVAGGACTAGETGSKTIPTPTWDKSVRACGDAPATGKGCGSGSCVPKPAAPFGSSVCIYQDGDHACPAPFSAKTLGHQSFTEGRDCSACTCGTPGTGCTGTLTLYTDDNCSQNVTAVAAPNTCVPLPVDPDPLTTFPPGSGGMPPADTRSGHLQASGNCPPTGGQVTGTATATGPVTFCCL